MQFTCKLSSSHRIYAEIKVRMYFLHLQIMASKFICTSDTRCGPSALLLYGDNSGEKINVKTLLVKEAFLAIYSKMDSNQGINTIFSFCNWYNWYNLYCGNG